MFKKSSNAISASCRKMTAAEQNRLSYILSQINEDGKIRTTQQSIPYIAMFPDGICQLNNTTYSKSIQYEDINYELVDTESKNAIFDKWCALINYFDSTLSVQLSYIHQKRHEAFDENIFHISQKEDSFNSVRKEYADMLRNQYSNAGKGMELKRCLTFSVKAERYKTAKTKLERIERNILKNFEDLDVKAQVMTGYDRLQVLYEMLHPSGEEFLFSWDWLSSSGLNTKDSIASSSFNFSNSSTFGIGKKTGAVSYLQITAPTLSDQLFRDLITLENEQIINIHLQSIEQAEAVKMIKRRVTDLDKMKIDEQKKALRNGYDMEILPSDLTTFGMEAKNLL